jgi:hypothetical protein
MQRMLNDHARILLTTHDASIFKLSLGTLCSSLSLVKVNTLLTTSLSLMDQDGRMLIQPRLEKWRVRLNAGKAPMGKRMFIAGGRLWDFVVANGKYPTRVFKCRVPESNIMNLCAAMCNVCSVGWRPSVFRPRIVGNRVVQFPYYVRNVDIEQLQHLVYAGGRHATLAGRGTLRRIAYYITEPMVSKECLSYYFTRFIATCAVMYTDLLKKLQQRVRVSPILVQTFDGHALTKLDEKLAEVDDMVRFGKYELGQQHLKVPQNIYLSHNVQSTNCMNLHIRT